MAVARGRPDSNLRSPYKPGNGLEPPYLGDRAEQLRRFRSFLEDPATPHNVVVTGLRGVGKTVLLQHYTAEAREANWLVAEHEFSEPDAEPATFIKRVLADLARLGRELSFSQRVKGFGGDLLAGRLAAQPWRLDHDHRSQTWYRPPAARAA